MSHPTEATLGNILVRQKDAIIELINDREFEAALDRLSCLQDLWYTCGYDYKFNELITRVRTATDTACLHRSRHEAIGEKLRAIRLVAG